LIFAKVQLRRSNSVHPPMRARIARREVEGLQVALYGIVRKAKEQPGGFAARAPPDLGRGSGLARPRRCPAPGDQRSSGQDSGTYARVHRPAHGTTPSIKKPRLQREPSTAPGLRSGSVRKCRRRRSHVVTLIGFVLILITHRARHDFPRHSRGRSQDCSPNLKGGPRNWAPSNSTMGPGRCR